MCPSLPLGQQGAKKHLCGHLVCVWPKNSKQEVVFLQGERKYGRPNVYNDHNNKPKQWVRETHLVYLWHLSGKPDRDVFPMPESEPQARFHFLHCSLDDWQKAENGKSLQQRCTKGKHAHSATCATNSASVESPSALKGVFSSHNKQMLCSKVTEKSHVYQWLIYFLLIHICPLSQISQKLLNFKSHMVSKIQTWGSRGLGWETCYTFITRFYHQQIQSCCTIRQLKHRCS